MIEDRFDKKKYSEDIEYEFCLKAAPQDESTSDRESIWISERLVMRLRNLAVAYKLELLSRLPGDGDWYYPQVQMESIDEEWVFLMKTVDDPLLVEVFTPVIELVSLAIRRPRGWGLLVSAP